MNYITSDWHFGHETLMRGYRSTIFPSVEEHDRVIENNIFSTLKKGDSLYFLGDAFWKWDNDRKKAFFDRLRGNSIQFYWIKGNHDKPFKHKAIIWTGDLKELRYNHTSFILCHYPMLIWNKSHYNSIQIHGHVHIGDKTYYKIAETPYYTGKHINVNVEFHDFKPVSIEKLYQIAEGLEDNWDLIKKET